MSAHLEVLFTVYHDQRDLTGWVTALEVAQPARTLSREWSVTLAGYTNLVEDGTWDIFATYDPSNPRAECLVRGGVVPPDRERSVSVQRGGVPTVTVRGYDHVYLAQRRAPRDTLVLVPDREGTTSAAAAIAQYGEAVGRYRVATNIRSLHSALRLLANGAGVNVQLSVPDYPLQPLVVSPTSTYWTAMLDLLKPLAAEVWYRRAANTLVVVDPLAPRYGLGRLLEIPGELVTGISGVPTRRRRVRRVIYQVPPWR